MLVFKLTPSRPTCGNRLRQCFAKEHVKFFDNTDMAKPSDLSSPRSCTSCQELVEGKKTVDPLAALAAPASHTIALNCRLMGGVDTRRNEMIPPRTGKGNT